eukprot:4813498-Amphidinium_carterae.3
MVCLKLKFIRAWGHHDLPTATAMTPVVTCVRSSGSGVVTETVLQLIGSIIFQCWASLGAECSPKLSEGESFSLGQECDW